MRKWFIISFICWLCDTLSCRMATVVSLLQCINIEVVVAVSLEILFLISIALKKKKKKRLFSLILAYVELAVQMKHNLSVSGNVEPNL